MESYSIDKSFRLPTDIIPHHYELKFEPDIDAKTFKGKETISVDVKRCTDKIVLNSLNLTISNVKFVHNSTEFSTTNITYNIENRLTCLSFTHLLPVGIARLSLEFSGQLDNSMRGLYLSGYRDDKGVFHKGLATQFEPNDACRAFPSFDEPSFKATFQVTVVCPREFTVLSNAKLECIIEDDSIATFKFGVTPKISTYLVALVIGHYDSRSSITQNGVELSVYAPIHKINCTEHALKAGVLLLDYYTKYFGIGYMMDKIDLVAIPDISIGAMENVGLVTFRQDLLVVDPLDSSMLTIENATLVIAHELAHQWFGNLVTMCWWNDLWLNEGFANWIEYLSTDSCFPELFVWKSFLSTTYCRGLELDSYLNSHPVEVEIRRPSEVDDIFDDITYCKGSAIINMLYDYVGDESFARGLNQYFNAHKYSNVKTVDLWTSLSQQSNDKPIVKVMSSFTQQSGFPVISLSSSHKNCSVTIDVHQKRFTYQQQQSSSSWVFPVSFRVGLSSNSVETKTELIEHATHTLDWSFSSQPLYILANPKRSGFYRTLYDSSMLNKLIENLRHLDYSERLGLVSDYFAFFKSGMCGGEVYLKILVNIMRSGERDYSTWECIVTSLHHIMLFAYHSPTFDVDYPLFKKFCSKLTKPILESLGYSSEVTPGTPDHDVKLKKLLLSLLCSVDDDICQILQSWFSQYKDGSIKVSPDFRRPMFKAAFSDPTMYEHLEKILKSTTMTEEVIDILSGLAGARDSSIITRAFELSLCEEIKPQDGRFAFSIFGKNPFAQQLSWEFISSNLPRLTKHFGSQLIMTRILKDSISGFFDLSYVDKINEVFEANKVELERSLLVGLESIKINHLWLKRDSADFSIALKKVFSEF